VASSYLQNREQGTLEEEKRRDDGGRKNKRGNNRLILSEHGRKKPTTQERELGGVGRGHFKQKGKRVWTYALGTWMGPPDAIKSREEEKKGLQRTPLSNFSKKSMSRSLYRKKKRSRKKTFG